MTEATMNETLCYRRTVCLLCGLMAVVPLSARSVTDAFFVSVKLTVVVEPCVINNNQPIKVEFGDVMTSQVGSADQVGSAEYLRRVDYQLDCPQGASTAMKMQIVGSGAFFDSDVLQTKPNEISEVLAIELRQGNTKLPINKWLNFTYPNKPDLWAVPVKKRGATLKGGEFTATATMKVDYQ